MIYNAFLKKGKYIMWAASLEKYEKFQIRHGKACHSSVEALLLTENLQWYMFCSSLPNIRKIFAVFPLAALRNVSHSPNISEGKTSAI